MCHEVRAPRALENKRISTFAARSDLDAASPVRDALMRGDPVISIVWDARWIRMAAASSPRSSVPSVAPCGMTSAWWSSRVQDDHLHLIVEADDSGSWQKVWVHPSKRVAAESKLTL